MLNQFKHQISEESIQLAQKHSQEINQLRKSLEKFGKTLQAQKNLPPELSQFMLERSQAIEQLINQAEDSLKKLKKTSSVQAYSQVAELHGAAAQEYILAVNKYLNHFFFSKRSTLKLLP